MRMVLNHLEVLEEELDGIEETEEELWYISEYVTALEDKLEGATGKIKVCCIVFLLCAYY